MFDLLILIIKNGINARTLLAMIALILVARVLPRFLDQLPDIIRAVSEARERGKKD